jgi:replicative DNA helicase
MKGVRLTWRRAITNTMGRIDRLFTFGPGGRSGLPTGLNTLDKVLQGLRKGEMIVLAADPSMGKTALAMNIVECVALGKDIYGHPMQGDHDRPHGVGVFSLVTSTETLAMRMLCSLAGVSSFKVFNGYGSIKTMNQKLTRAADELAQAPIYVDDSGGFAVMDLRLRARQMARDYKVELIVIDHLQSCNGRKLATRNRPVATSLVSRQIKVMAGELNLPVIVLIRLDRTTEPCGDNTDRPTLADLYGSGTIAQDADVVLLLHRPCKMSGDPESDDMRLAIVDVAKHRNGATGEVRLDFDKAIMRFGDRIVPDIDPIADLEL